MVYQDLEKEILYLCSDDETELWLIINRVSKYSYNATIDSKLVREKTIEIIRKFLTDDLIEVGNPNELSFEKLLLSVDETIAYIEEEWNKLSKTPNLGDICWFRATPKGEQVAHELGLI
jgi:hypothetical protein